MFPEQNLLNSYFVFTYTELPENTIHITIYAYNYRVTVRFWNTFLKYALNRFRISIKRYSQQLSIYSH